MQSPQKSKKDSCVKLSVDLTACLTLKVKVETVPVATSYKEVISSLAILSSNIIVCKPILSLNMVH